MIISHLHGLSQDEIDEILCDQGGKLADVLCNGAEVAVLNMEVDNGNLLHSYYNVIFANGARLEGLSGCHLRNIETWSDS